MHNNNCLSHWEPAIDTHDHFGLENSQLESPINSPLKDSDMFIKSQLSMADTACDDPSPISLKFQDNPAHEHSFSFTEFTLEESRSGSDEEPLCQNFCQQGFCMLGVECTKLHCRNVENSEQTQERGSFLVRLFKEMPQMVIWSRKRMGLFQD